MSSVIGSIDPTKKRVVIVGAGVSGLLIADRLIELGFDVDLYEAKDRVGGLIETLNLSRGISERAAHSLLVTQELESWFKKRGIVLTELRNESRARFIVRDGRLSRFPIRVLELLGILFRVFFARATKKEAGSRMTIGEWATTHLGPAANAYLLDPFVRGIFASRTRELTVRAAFPSLEVPPGHSLVSRWIATKLTRTLPAPPKRSKKKMVALAHGMESLPARLFEGLKKSNRFKFFPGHRFSESEWTQYSHCNRIVATDAMGASLLLRREAPVLSERLARLPYAPLVSITVFAREADFGTVPRGVGVLVPEVERDYRVLGVLFNSSAFSGRVKQSGDVSLTVMLGGAGDPEVVEASESELETRVRDALNRMFRLTSDAKLELHVARWPRAIPIYGAHCEELWDEAREGWCARPGQLLVGNYTGEVSVRGMIENAIKLNLSEAKSG